MPLISDLPNGGAVQAGDLVLVSRGNQNVVLSGSQFANAAVAAQVQAALGNSGVVPGTYVIPALTVDATGRITSASNGQLSIPTKISDLTDDVGLSLKSANAALTPGTYVNANITVGLNGQINLIANGTGGGGGGGATTLQPVAFNYYKLVIGKSRGGSGPGFAEIQFRAAAGASSGTTITAATGTVNGSFPISNAYDGNTTTFFTTAGNIPAGGASLTFTLSQAINLKQIYILPRQDGYPDEVPAEIMLYGSTDGLTYSALGIVTPDNLGAAGSAAAVTYAVSTIPSVVSGSGQLFAAGGTFEFDSNGNSLFADLQGCTVTRVGTGRYQVTFTKPMADANYGVLASGKWGAPDSPGSYQTPVVGMDRGYANSTTTASFYLISETYAGGQLYDARVFFAVYPNATALMQSASGGGGGGNGDGLYSIPMTAPKVADFPILTEQYAGPLTTVDDSDLGLTLTMTPSQGNRPSALLKNLPATGDWQVEMRIDMNTVAYQYHCMGFALTDTNSQYMHLIGLDMPASSGVMYCNWQYNRYYRSNGGGFSGGYFVGRSNINHATFIRLSYTASSQTNTVFISRNGKNWRSLGSWTDGTIGGKYNMIGVGFGQNAQPGDQNNGHPVNDPTQFDQFSIPHWKQSF